MDNYSLILDYLDHNIHIVRIVSTTGGHGIQEVSGSIPLISTKHRELKGFGVFLLFSELFWYNFMVGTPWLDRLIFSEI